MVTPRRKKIVKHIFIGTASLTHLENIHRSTSPHHGGRPSSPHHIHSLSASGTRVVSRSQTPMGRGGGSRLYHKSEEEIERGFIHLSSPSAYHF